MKPLHAILGQIAVEMDRASALNQQLQYNNTVALFITCNVKMIPHHSQNLFFYNLSFGI